MRAAREKAESKVLVLCGLPSLLSNEGQNVKGSEENNETCLSRETRQRGCEAVQEGIYGYADISTAVAENKEESVANSYIKVLD